MRNVPSRKTDVKDAEWIADLLQHGLLRASYIPDSEQLELRELSRYRKSLIEERARELNRLQKYLKVEILSLPVCYPISMEKTPAIYLLIC